MRSVEELQAPSLAPFLRGGRAYRVHVGNPRAAIAGPSTFPRAIIVSRAGRAHVEDDGDAREALNARWAPVENEVEARLVVEAFLALRSYSLQDRPPPRGSAPSTAAPPPWPLTVTESDGQWSFSGGVLVDPAICAVVRYELVVSPTALVSVRQRGGLFRCGGYR